MDRGGVAGFTEGGNNIINCYTTGLAHGLNAGGLVGNNDGALTITNCYTSIDVSSTDTSGGFVGANFFKGSLSITNGYSTGSITSAGGRFGNNAGGFVGNNVNELTITNAYNTGAISGDPVGGFAGTSAGTPVITNSYWNAETTGQLESIGERPDTDGGLSTNEFYLLSETESGWSTDNWDFGTNEQYPTLRRYEENAMGSQVEGSIFTDQPCPRVNCLPPRPIFWRCKPGNPCVC